MLQDLRHALRRLRAERLFAIVVVATLALGIGANTAIFAAVNRLLLNPLPYPEADRLVYLSLSSAGVPFGYPTPDYMAEAWRREARGLDAVAAFARLNMLAYDDRGARVVAGMRITPGFPTLLGARPVLGRAFTSNDARPGEGGVVLISHEMWQRDYGGSPDVLGRALTLDDVLHTVVGVMPPRWNVLAGSADRDVWLPLPLATGSEAGVNPVQVVGRLRSGVSIDDVGPELDTIAMRAREAAANPLIRGDFFTLVTRAADQLVASGTRDALLVLLAAVGLVLLTACANVANLLLARGVSRVRELAVRAALGAGRARVARQLMIESLVLALVAGIVGLGVGALLLEVLGRLRPEGLAALADVRLDPSVLAFTFGISLATGLVFGLLPALQLSASALGNTLRQGGSGVVRGGSGARLRSVLVGGEVAIAVILLIGATLLVRSVVHLQQVELGYDDRNLFAMSLALPRERYPSPASRELFAEQMIERVRGMPGVDGVTQAFTEPDSVVMMSGLEVRGSAMSEAVRQTPHAMNFVRPGYFATMRIPVLEGRVFTDAEARGGQVVMVDQAAAQRLWPDGDAVGREIRRGGGDWATVVGVVGNVALLDTPPILDSSDRHPPHFYWPYDEDDVPSFIGAPPGAVLIVRAASDPASLIDGIRAAIAALDPQVAIPRVSFAETERSISLATPRFNMALLGAFAILALVLAAVGLVAVIGYTVTERTHEIGIRMALGAGEDSVLWLVIRHSLFAAVAGIGIGVVGALAASRLLSGLLYGITPTDTPTYVGVVALLLVVALAASWLPAQRAARVDPVIALRDE